VIQKRYDFANLLLSGPCNARCGFCIGWQMESAAQVNNLDRFPLANLETFADEIEKHTVRQVVVTGTNTDPLLYRHTGRLLAWLRERLGSGIRVALHTNGRLALERIDRIDLYDRATISIPSFEPDTYRRMMGVPGPPDLKRILTSARPRVKLSCIVTRENAGRIGPYLHTCRALGLRRVVLRKLQGDPLPWSAWIDPPRLGLTLAGEYRGNPVFSFGDLQVTLWDFDQTGSRSINLFSTGRISYDYRLI